jgi:hypothetical protein
MLPIAAAPRLWQMIADQGVFWPDEIYQTIEQAHRLAFGYGWIPWEFRQGARSWIFPGILAGIVKLASFLGLASSGVGVVMTVRFVMLALALLGVYAAMRIGAHLGGRLGALLAGAMVALCPPLLVFGTRCMTEMASGPLIAMAALLVMKPSTTKRAAIAGVLASMAIFFRYQNGLFGVAFFVLLLATRQWKPLASYTLTATLFGILGGALDWIVWGRPFQSFFVYVRFNLIEGQAARWGVSTFDFYFHTLWTSLQWALPLVVLGFFASFRRARVLPLACLANLAAHTAIPHKEYRFLMPMLPLALGLAGGGLGWLLGGLLPADRTTLTRFQSRRARAGGWIATVLAVAIGVVFAERTRTITFGQMGHYIGGREDGWAPWHAHEGVNRALWEASKHDDVCGIAIIGVPMVSIGGYSYLHHNVPMLGSMSPVDLAATNYLATPRLWPPPPGYQTVKSFEIHVRTGPRTDKKASLPADYDYVLFRREGGCTPPPPWFTPNFAQHRAPGEEESLIALDAMGDAN